MEEDASFRELVGTELSEIREGCAVVDLRAGGRHLNPNGTTHRGAVRTLIDVSMVEASRPMTGEGKQPMTIE